MGSPALYGRSTTNSTAPSTAVNIALQLLLYASKGGPRGTKANLRAKLTF